MSEEKESLINNSSTDETDEENQVTVAETSGSSPFTNCLPASSNMKRNLKDFTVSNEEHKRNAEVESNVKRVKNEEQSSAEDSSGEGASLEDLVFSIELILRNILGALNSKDLLSTRLVNRLWNLESTKLLLQNNNVHRIHIRNDTATSWSEYRRINIGTLEDFQNLVENSMIFPCNRFVVRDGPLSDRTKDFFENNGHLVKYFKLDEPTLLGDKQNKTITYDIISLASKHLPNLEMLEFACSYIMFLPSPGEINEVIECASEMKKLHTLELNGDFPTPLLSLVLSKAKNLKNIYFDRRQMSQVYKIGLEKLLQVQDAIPRLQNIRLEFSPDLLDVYEKIVMQTPRFSIIESISASTDYKDLDLQRVGRILSAIFGHSSESLTEILNLRSLSHIPGLTIPVFPNLKRLQIDLIAQKGEVCPVMLPSGVNLADKCPNVRTVESNFRGDYRNIGPGQILPQELWEPFLSVRHLQVEFGFRERFLSDEWVERLCSLFPNLTSARFLVSVSDWALEYFGRRGIRITVESRYNWPA